MRPPRCHVSPSHRGWEWGKTLALVVRRARRVPLRLKGLRARNREDGRTYMIPRTNSSHVSKLKRKLVLNTKPSVNAASRS